MTQINMDNAIINKQRKQEIIDSRVQFSEHVIPYQRDRKKKKRVSWRVPIRNLYLRKDNSRIRAEVLTWEKNNGAIDEFSTEGQKKLREFLRGSDPERMDELNNSLKLMDKKCPLLPLLMERY